jgi:arylsulfatase A-like enzyme
MTGQFTRRTGVNNGSGLPLAYRTLPQDFHEAGWQTWMCGKWHLGGSPDNAFPGREYHPDKRGFDHFYGFLGPEIDYFTHVNQRGVIDWARDGKTVEEKGYSTTLIADEAIAQLKQRDRRKPFYMQVAFNAPHTPLAAPAELIAKYKSDALYTAVVEGLDLGIGRILATLDEQGLRANTVVVFCSDNGATRRFSPNTPLSFGKGTVQEGGIRVPAIVRWPGKVAAGVLSQQPVAAHDLFPSLLAALSLPIPEKLKFDGSNQWPALSTGKTIPRPAFLIAAQDIAFFDGDWKIIETSPLPICTSILKKLITILIHYLH